MVQKFILIMRFIKTTTGLDAKLMKHVSPFLDASLFPSALQQNETCTRCARCNPEIRLQINVEVRLSSQITKWSRLRAETSEKL